MRTTVRVTWLASNEVTDIQFGAFGGLWQHKHLSWTRVALVASTACIACTGTSSDRSERRASDVAVERCEGLSAPVDAVPPDSVSNEMRCQLARRAIASLALSRPADGVERGDTALVSRVLITPLTEELANQVASRATWHVSLSLQGRPYDAEVVIDRQTDSLSVIRSHKPLGQH
jgi:hypothetical protein